VNSSGTYEVKRARRRTPLLTALTVLGAAIWIAAPAALAAAGPSGAPGSAQPLAAPSATASPTPASSASPSLAPTPTPVPKPIPPLPPILNTKGVSTQISLQVPTGSVLGNDVVVAAVLTDTAGAPMVAQRVGFYLDGQEIQSDKTDAGGRLSFTILGKKLSQARVYQVAAQFGGIHGFAGSSVASTLTVLSAAIQISSVPPMPGLGFTLGSATALTGPDGVAALPVPQSGTYRLTADLNTTALDPSVRLSFVRWLDNVETATRTIDVRGPASYTIGLRVAYPAYARFVDLGGQPVDSSQVDEAQFEAGSSAFNVVLNQQTGAQSAWWTAATADQAGGKLVATPISYRVTSVKIHGAEVLVPGQAPWTPVVNGTWTIQVELFGMTVQTRDAFFGTPVAGQLQLSYPDGDITTQDVGSDGVATFTDLPAGQYSVGWAHSMLTPATSVVVTKLESTSLRVITMADIGLTAAAGMAILVVLGLVVWFIISRLRSRGRRIDRAVGLPA
jgi:hypothetical protein